MSLPKSNRPEEWTVEEIESVLLKIQQESPEKYKRLLNLLHSCSSALASPKESRTNFRISARDSAVLGGS